MTALACVILILCVLSLMVSFGVGPFANEPFYRFHLSFKQRHKVTQSVIQMTAAFIGLICSLWIIGIFA